ncbi:TIGR02466 family protein [Rugamonas apoptosis]|uniref:2OG-Fe(II) oxygenase n=1 Tax=Rugamonas apoptosis TaxID=2758570 RepID=A0A7W2FA77_9BURK|nr:TIGR02466 family protein [Rugamonas apoptosis]MBA5687983.1 hypothetical protein [Rugamonas apoptosis]
MKLTTQDLFPTRIWVFELDELLEQHPGWIDQILAMREASPVPAGRSNRQGWNSDKTVFAVPQFEPLQRLAQTAFVHAFKDLALKEPLRFQLEAWVNMLDVGGSNLSHVHPHTLLAGCYYLQACEQSSPIVFRDPRPGVMLTALPGTGVHSESTVSLHPKPGQLVVFPSWLEHRVELHTGPQARISIAMNAIQV